MRSDEQSCPQRSDESGAAEGVTDWVTKGTPMPPSTYPAYGRPHAGAAIERRDGISEDSRTAVARWSAAPAARLRRRPGFNYRDQSGIASQNPEIKGVLPQLVPRVDADGNEVAGIKSPLLMAPLGTYTAGM